MADAWQIDPTRVGILGSSAGAHLAALVALGRKSSKFVSGAAAPKASSFPDLKALVAIYGIYDLMTHWQDDLSSNPDPKSNVTRNFLGADPFEEPQLYFDASPLRYVTYERNKLSVFLAWGTNDDAVNPRQSEMFLKALQQARFNVRAHRVIGATHWWFNEPPQRGIESAEFAPRLFNFLAANL